MNKAKVSTLDGLNHLLARNNDAMKGYVEVANNINYANLTKWLIDFSKQREVFASELEFQIQILGGDPESETTILGELHRVWVEIKATWTENDTAALLDECIRGEEKALEDYNEVIAVEVLREGTRDVLRKQRKQIQKAIEDLKMLKKIFHDMEQEAL